MCAAAIPAEFEAVRRGRGERADSLSKQLQPVMLRVDSIVEQTSTFLQQRTAQKVQQANIEAGKRAAADDDGVRLRRCRLPDSLRSG